MKDIQIKYVEIGGSLGCFTNIIEGFNSKGLSISRTAVFVDDKYQHHIQKHIIGHDKVYHIDSIVKGDMPADIMFIPLSLAYKQVGSIPFSGESNLGDSAKSLKILKAIKPKAVVLELPESSVKAFECVAFKVIYRLLSELGYKIDSREFCSENFGSIHIRRRVYIVASLIDRPFKWIESKLKEDTLSSILLASDDDRLNAVLLNKQDNQYLTNESRVVKHNVIITPESNHILDLDEKYYSHCSEGRKAVLKINGQYRRLHPVEIYRSLTSVRDTKVETYLSELDLDTAISLISKMPCESVLKTVIQAVIETYLIDGRDDGY